MKILSFDVEANGLQGPAFAVAGLVLNGSGSTISEYSARCPIEGPVDDFVREQVLPQCTDMPEDCKTALEMRNGFWAWYSKARLDADFIVAQNPYPVESRFLIACQDDDLKSRYWDHPFPLIDLTSLLVAHGAFTREDRETYIVRAIGNVDNRSHDPRYDAWAAAKTALAVLTGR